MHVANFACTGAITVTLTVNDPIDTIVIHPKSRNIMPTKSGNQVTFSLPAPDNLYIEINALPALCLFANPVRKTRPKPTDDHVIYFGPGVHHAGVITLKDNDVLYVDGGAIVYGLIRGNPKNARIMGNGIIDGQYKDRLVYLEDASQLSVSDVILRNGRGWQNTLVRCDGVEYRNVKVVSFGNSGDGINPVGSSNVTIDRCFLRCTDDCIAIKATESTQIVENIQVTNNIMVGYAFSDGITIGFETNGPYLRNVLVKNCDIVKARGGSKVDGHSAFSIICDGPARISNIRYEDIRVEDASPKAFEIQITDGTLYGDDPPGYVSGVCLKNVFWDVAKPIIIKGFDASHRVENVVFEGCHMAGKQLSATSHDEQVSVNEFVDGVTFR